MVAWAAARHFISNYQASYYRAAAKRELQEGVNISPETIAAIESSFQKIMKGEDTDGMHFYKSQHAFRVFTLAEAPGLVFKMNAAEVDGSLQERYHAMIQAKVVCMVHYLSLLIIPHAKLFTINIEGKQHEVIAEEKLDITPEESKQEELYEQYAPKLDEAIRQFAFLIIKRELSDIEWRNVPLLNSSLEEQQCRIAAIDLEPIRPFGRDGAECGLFGSAYYRRRGLINCVSKAQGEIVVDEARKHLWVGSNLVERMQESQAKRKEELEDIRKLRIFYEEHNIQSGNEQIAIDLKKLEFPGYNQSEKFCRLAHQLLREINTTVSQSSHEQSIKKRRTIYINTNEYGEFYRMDYNCPDINPDAKHEEQTFLSSLMSSVSFSKKEETNLNAENMTKDDTYLAIVTKRLIEIGAIYSVVARNGNGYTLQA